MLILGGILVSAQENRSHNPEAPAAVARKISCLGRVTPGDKVIQISGPYTLQGPSIVKELFVRRGDKVQKNQELARLHNHGTALAQLRQSEADLEVALKSLEQVKAGEKAGVIAAQEAVVLRLEDEMKTANLFLQRDKELAARKILADTDLEHSRLNWSVAQKNYDQGTNSLMAIQEVRAVDLRLAEAKVLSARASVQRSQAELELATIRAPLDGYILEILTYPGEIADRNPILQMGDLDHMQVQAEVYVTDIAGVRLQAHAVIRGDGFTGEISGTVTEIGRQVDRSAIFDPDPASFSDRRVVKVWIKLEDPRKLQGLVNHQVNVVIMP
ncbi:MAG: exporter rane fusion protein DevB family [Verrucomicrobiales bacterium]|nr:exporter rane fusion protein DevB family [Verrucomicrobiales bacterium]